MNKLITIFTPLAFMLASSVYPQTIRLLSPAEREKLEANSEVSVVWQSSKVEKVNIELSLSNGTHWFTIASALDASAGKFSWKVPNSQTIDAVIRITGSALPEISDSKSFSIYMKNKPRLRSLNKESEVSSTAVKIMLLGDSITEGEGDDIENSNPIYNLKRIGYREELFNLLSQAGYNFRFVGNEITGYDTYPVPPNTDFYNFGRYNEGHGGWTADGGFAAGKGAIEDNITGWLTDLQPNDVPGIVLLHIGTNDLNEDEPATIKNDVANVLARIGEYDSDILTVFSSLIYYNHVDKASLSEQSALKQLLQTEANTLMNSGENVSFINMNSVLTQNHYPYFYTQHQPGFPNDFRDIHPNTFGYSLMAQRWFNKLQSLLPVLQLKVLLQGPFSVSLNKMSTGLNSVIPEISPYTAAPDTVSYTIPLNITDWVLIEIRNNNNVLVKSKSCFLRDDGLVIDPDGLSENIYLGIQPGSYYLVVKHRNHLAIMSSDLVELNGLTAYDFTTGNNKAYTTGPNPMVNLASGKFGMYSGDGNSSGFITASDNNLIWLPQNGLSGYYSGDYNLSGNVTAADNDSYWLINNGKASQVP